MITCIMVGLPPATTILLLFRQYAKVKQGDGSSVPRHPRNGRTVPRSIIAVKMLKMMIEYIGTYYFHGMEDNYETD